MITLILFLIGIAFLIFGADLLVRGASSLALAIGISPLVVGLTVVAFGTSSPELAVILQSSFVGQSDIAIGNVVGSNICNILVVLGLTAIFTPIIVQQKLLRFDVPLMIAISFLVLLMGLDGAINRLDGAILFAGIITYTFWSVYQSRRENTDRVKVSLRFEREVHLFTDTEQQHLIETIARATGTSSDPIAILPIASGSVEATLQIPRNAAFTLTRLHQKRDPVLREAGIVAVDIPRMANVSISIEENVQDFSQTERGSFAMVLAHTLNINPDLVRILPLEPESKTFTIELPREHAKTLVAMCERSDPALRKLRFLKIERQKLAWVGHVAMLVLGLVLLSVGANWLVNGAVAFATWLGVSELIIGLTIVAVGTSLPEIATSVVAGMRGEGDIVVGNVIGSNIFNILLVLGLPSLITPIAVSLEALTINIPVMIAVALACFPIFFTGSRISRLEGILFTSYYVFYVLYLVLDAMGSVVLVPFITVMLVLVPLTFVALLATMVYDAVLARRRYSHPA